MRLFGLYIGREPLPRTVEKVEYVDRVVLGTPAPVTLYRVTDNEYEARSQRWRALGLVAYESMIPVDQSKPAEWHGRYYHSCEQAFTECPAAKVTAISGWVVGDQFVTGLHATPITVQPKPKVAKGRRS